MTERMIVPGVYEFNPGNSDNESEDPKLLERRERFARNSNLPADSRHTKRLHNFENIAGREEGLQAAMELIRGELIPPILLLYGEPGRSKTHLAMAIAWAFIASLKTVKFWPVPDLLDALREGIKINRLLQPGEHNSGDYNLIMKQLKEWDLIVLDDIGMEHATNWTTPALDMVVNHRYSHGLATVITTNTLEISDRILDRCKEGRIVMLKGQSFREILAQRRKGKQADTSGVDTSKYELVSNKSSRYEQIRGTHAE